ncbi:hypothetical protein Hanom_Chr03g00249121 [Helianthus anomalus]
MGLLKLIFLNGVCVCFSTESDAVCFYLYGKSLTTRDERKVWIFLKIFHMG